ncbi:Na+/H+ antiporter subunit C [Salisaeta longa]|uniref:Na+/H+ antiporter subunit C n=1 Tax=Salisaeta longa TaxID=503170 RepID=UPI0003B2F4B4|nr:Na+/H+ antiporter subunit C [Salisaeta longa]
MEIVLAIVSGLLFACSFYLMMRRNLLRFVIGLIILSNAVNLLIFTMGRLTRGEPPLIPHHGASTLAPPYANPLPQALILTAIVISFGLLAFTLVLVYRNYTVGRTVDADALQASEPARPPAINPEGTPRLPA